MTKDGKLNEGIFRGETINTPSMLCVEDALDGLRWAESVGGLKGLIARSEANLAAIAATPEDEAYARALMEKAISFKSTANHGETPKMAACCRPRSRRARSATTCCASTRPPTRA